jgi:hypothetical protein
MVIHKFIQCVQVPRLFKVDLVGLDAGTISTTCIIVLLHTKLHILIQYAQIILAVCAAVSEIMEGIII